jgi:outer membrane protein, heavy metal efflux system
LRKLIFILLTACLFPGSFLHGEEGLTLEQAIAVALRQNPKIFLAQKELSKSQGIRMQLAALPDPTLVFSSEGISTLKNPPVEGEKEINFGIEQNLEFPGKRALRAQIGRLGEEQAAYELERARLLVKAQVKKAYYNAVLAMETIQSLNKAITILDQATDNLLIQYQAGSASYSDILRAKVEKARTQNQIIEMQKESESARAELNLVLGRKGDEPLELLTGMAYTSLEKDLNSLEAEARILSPTLKAMGARRRQAQAALKLSYRSRLPDFSLGLYYPNKRNNAWGFSVSLNLPVWRKKQQGAILEARALSDIADASLELEERLVMVRIDRYYRSAKAAAEQVELFEQKLLKDIADEVQLGIGQLQYGKIEFFNLLDLFRTYSSAQLEYLKALHLYLVSLADIELVGEEYPN